MIYIEWAKKSTDSEEFKDWSSERMFPSHKSFSLATCLVASFLEFLTKPKNSKELPGRSSSYKDALLYFCLSLWPPVIQYQKLWDHFTWHSCKISLSVRPLLTFSWAFSLLIQESVSAISQQWTYLLSLTEVTIQCHLFGICCQLTLRARMRNPAENCSLKVIYAQLVNGC